MLKEKTLSQLNKVKIYQEVNFYQVSHYREIKQAQLQLIEPTKVEKF